MASAFMTSGVMASWIFVKYVGDNYLVEEDGSVQYVSAGMSICLYLVRLCVGLYEIYHNLKHVF